MRVLIRGAVRDVTGYATVTRELALALECHGVEVILRQLPWGFTPLELPAGTEQQIDVMLRRGGAGDCQLNIGIPPQFQRSSGWPTAGLTMLEVDGVSPGWTAQCNQMDQLWVPSSFNQQTFIRGGVTASKVKVVPLGVNTREFTPEGSRFTLYEVRPDTFRFLSVFEWVPRKGYDLLIQAYMQEFTIDDNVCLILRTHSNGPGYDPEGTAIRREIRQLVNRYCVDSRQVPSVVMISQALPAQQMPQLYRACDCFVLPTRGEGWNLPALEALACGVPVITTAWSAHLDWLNQDNSYLIQVESLVPVPHLGTPNDQIYQGCCWAKPSLTDLRRLMRLVYTHRAVAKEKALRARSLIEQQLSWEACADRVVVCLLSLAG